jgi:hypothetical protein
MILESWPTKAGVLELSELADTEIKRLINDPQILLRPESERLFYRRPARVQASVEDWQLLVFYGWTRGIFEAIPESKILKSASGQLVLNGAAAVPKLTWQDGKEIPSQRFISNLVPSNEFMAADLDGAGDAAALPFVTRLLGAMVPDDHCLVVDSEDLKNAFNLFRVPESWRGMFACVMPVEGWCVGRFDLKTTFVALTTVPMGWAHSAGIIQRILRRLIFNMAQVNPSAEVASFQPLATERRRPLARSRLSR